MAKNEQPAKKDDGLKKILMILVMVAAAAITVFVLIAVAMVGIALLGFMPAYSADSGTSATTDARIGDSTSYWLNARPFAIWDHVEKSGSSGITLIIQSTEAGQIQLTNIDIGGSGRSGSYKPTGSDRFLTGGEKKVLQIPLSAPCTSGQTYEYDVNFTYGNADGSAANQKQYGTKPLVSKCI